MNTKIVISFGLVLAFIGMFFLNQRPTGFTAGKVSSIPLTAPLDGADAVGIVVKNGNSIDKILADNFTRETYPCDLVATSTPSQVCERVLYLGKPVKVYYSAPRNSVTAPFNRKAGDFPFSGSVEYVNKTDTRAEADLLKYILEQGNATYTIIYEN